MNNKKEKLKLEFQEWELKYIERFDTLPNGYEGIDFGDDYKYLIKLIKKALEKNKEIPDLLGVDYSDPDILY